MPVRPSRPADTRMMTIVHDALRRDLRRTSTALAADPPPAGGQRAAIARHIGWMMEFLRAHHASEDEGLYPVVRERHPDADALLDRMDADHLEVARSVDAVDVAASEYGRTDDPAARGVLAGAVAELERVLLPHLRREEDEVMPLVSEVLSQAEWRAIEHEHNVAPKGPAQLAKEGHWLIDGAGAADRATVLGLVPPVPRFVLLHGFARSYRRERDACWRPGAAVRDVQRRGRTEVVVDAAPDAVWDVVVDPTRVGEWSHECVGCSFLDGASQAVPGARFRGRNRQGVLRWGRVCEVISSDDRELVWRTVPSALYPDSTEWRIRVTPAGGGTRIEQCFEVLRAPRILSKVYATLLPAHRDRSSALAEDLRRLGGLAGASTPSRPVVAEG